MRRYAYVGPPELAAASTGPAPAIGSRAQLAAWITRHAPALRDEGYVVTWVVTVDGAWRVAPRRSEHVACAGGGAVLGAGEATLARDARVVEASNLSTGYCPEPACWSALAAALDHAAIPRPAGFAHALVFRRCAACGQRNVVRDEHFACAVCDAPLPAAWNFET
ncbi:MAG: hypothetical protein U0325_08080 [Polyangiales bacterium]